MAVRGGRKDIVKYLVDKGAKISIKDVFRVSTYVTVPCRD